MAVQSPIEFNTRTVSQTAELTPLVYHGHFSDAGKASIVNTGTSTNITFPRRGQQPFITGGPLGHDKYIFEQLHFHWADHDACGSEHTIEGGRYSMEAHAVHYNAKYRDFKEAVDKPDGLAVTGFFIQALGDTDCPDFEKIVRGVLRIRSPGYAADVDADCLRWMDQLDLSKHYYTYKGSLTTPPFYESVTWIVYRHPIYVSQQQVATFRDLVGNDAGKNITSNYRPVQVPKKTPKIAFVRSCRMQSKL